MVDFRAFTASDLATAIRRERKAQKLKQEDLAKRAGITRQTVIDLEAGKNTTVYVLMGVIAALGKALQVTDARPSFGEVQQMFDEEDASDGNEPDQDSVGEHAPGRRG